MPTVYELNLEQLTDRMVAWDEPAFRAKQIWSQLWKRAATYDSMSDVAPALRERLAEQLPLSIEVLAERTADRGATRKALLRLGSKHVIETVLIATPTVSPSACRRNRVARWAAPSAPLARWASRTT